MFLNFWVLPSTGHPYSHRFQSPRSAARHRYHRERRLRLSARCWPSTSARAPRARACPLSVRAVDQSHPDDRPSPHNSQPTGIALGPDGNIWVAETGRGAIAKITPAGIVTEFALGAGNQPYAVTSGIGGVVWITERSGVLSTIDSAGHVRGVALPNGVTAFAGITKGPDAAMWFTDGHTHAIGRIDASGKVSEFPLPPGEAPPSGITVGSDGNLWFSEDTEPLTTQNAGRITPSGQIALVKIPHAEQMDPIVTGPDGNVYIGDRFFTLNRLTPSGAVTPFAVTLGYPAVVGLAVGPDRNVWMISGWARFKRSVLGAGR